MQRVRESDRAPVHKGPGSTACGARRGSPALTRVGSLDAATPLQVMPGPVEEAGALLFCPAIPPRSVAAVQRGPGIVDLVGSRHGLACAAVHHRRDATAQARFVPGHKGRKPAPEGRKGTGGAIIRGGKGRVGNDAQSSREGKRVTYCNLAAILQADHKHAVVSRQAFARAERHLDVPLFVFHHLAHKGSEDQRPRFMPMQAGFGVSLWSRGGKNTRGNRSTGKSMQPPLPPATHHGLGPIVGV